MNQLHQLDMKTGTLLIDRPDRKQVDRPFQFVRGGSPLGKGGQ